MASTEPLRKYSGLTTPRYAVTTGAALQLFDDARTNVAEKEAGDPTVVQPNLGFRELKNLDAANAIYIGKDNTVTTANGYKILPGQAFNLSGVGVLYLGPIFAIAETATVNVATFQY